MKKLGIALFSLLFAGFRFFGVTQSFWIDEATSITAARLPLSDIIFTFAPQDFHPPLYYIFLKYWTVLFGYTEVSTRFLSIVFSLLTILVVWRLVSEHVSSTAGLFSALLLSVNPLFFYYSQEARMYMMAAFFVSLSVYFYLKFIDSFRFSSCFWFATSLCVGIFTHYFVFFMIPVFVIHSFLVTKKHRFTIFLTLVPTALLVFLWLPIFFQQLSHGSLAQSSLWSSVLGGSDIKTTVLVPVKFLIGRIRFEPSFVYALVVGIIFTIVVVCLVFVKRRLMFFWLWLFVPFALCAGVSLFFPILNYFRLLYLVPALCILMGVGITAIHLKPMAFLVFGLLFSFWILCSCIYIFNPQFHREDWKSFSSIVETESAQKSSAVVFVQNSQMEAYMYYSHTVPALSGMSLRSPAYSQIWLMRYVQDLFDPNDLVRKHIESLGYRYDSSYDFTGVIVWKYERI